MSEYLKHSLKKAAIRLRLLKRVRYAVNADTAATINLQGYDHPTSDVLCYGNNSNI